MSEVIGENLLNSVIQQGRKFSLVIIFIGFLLSIYVVVSNDYSVGIYILVAYVLGLVLHMSK